MPAFIALLRGVNVGKAKRVPMAQLRAVLTSLGYERVATLLNSGNAVFHADKNSPAKLAQQIAGALLESFGFEIPVLVKSAADIDQAVAENRLAATATDPSRLLAVFVQDAGDLAGMEGVSALVVPPEEFLIGRHGAYLNCASGILESKAGKALLGKGNRTVTSRNWATVLKLQALAASSGG